MLIIIVEIHHHYGLMKLLIILPWYLIHFYSFYNSLRKCFNFGSEVIMHALQYTINAQGVRYVR